MTEQQLDGPHVGAALEQMDREGVAQECGVMGLEMREARCASWHATLHRIPSDGVAGDIAGEEPRFGFCHSPPLPQDFQQLGRKHYVAIFLPLALIDADDHTLAIDVGRVSAGRPQRFATPRRNRS